MKRYNPKEIEPRWQKIWEESGVYTADLTSAKPKYIAMSMFNYPSGAGIHIGHAMNYTISDVKARFKRQQGYESYHPVGWDAFGLPAENYAIKAGVSPQESMATIIPSYHKQYKAMGWSNDWEKEISTHLPEYYKWTQWIFAQMYKNNLAYQDSRMQWWCTKCQTVLANEQVIDGKCWRHDGADDLIVEKKEVKQWFFKITDYADELLDAIEDLDWTESVKLAQKNWIGKSVGSEVTFDVDQDLSGQDFVFLHGFKGKNSEVFWPWLKQEVEQRGGTVFAPDLPNTEHPNIDEQVDFVLKNYSFGPKTRIVTHSLGGVLAMKLLPKLKVKVEQIIMVAPPLKTEFLDGKKRLALEEATDWAFDFERVKENVNNIVVLGDKGDDIVPIEHPRTIASELQAELYEVNASNPHFNSKQERSVLEQICPSINVFTTRIDTLFSGAFLVLAPEHPLALGIATKLQKPSIDKYIKDSQNKSDIERQQEGKDKSGVFTGAYAINPANGDKLPIWVADFVLGGYGTGAIFGDIHDERDFEFIQKFDIPAKVSVVPEDKQLAKQVLNKEVCFTEEGVLINSEQFDGMHSAEAREKITEWLEKKGSAQEKVNYKMRDWSVSRQRYWGAPIPIVNCQKCGQVLVPDEDLPVVLPELEDFQPSGDGRSALARAKDWLIVDCPKCGGQAERETDTLDTYICSSWYMYRYFDPHNQQEIFNSEIVKKWEPIDFYNGADHATAHLLYARFIARFFTSLGLVKNPEPFKHFLFNGKVTASDGTMFSKSKGNGVDPLEIIEQGYGADALRTYLMFAAPLELWAKWDSQGVPGTHRFLSRLWTLVQEYLSAPKKETNPTQTKEIQHVTHQMIKKMTEDIEHNSYNTAIASAMGTLNSLYRLKAEDIGQNEVWQVAIENLVACIAPFAPHIADELWQQLGHDISVHKDSWPQWNDKYLATDTMTIVVQVNGKLRAEIVMPTDATKEVILKTATENENVQKFVGGKSVEKQIYVPGRLVNLVVV